MENESTLNIGYKMICMEFKQTAVPFLGGLKWN